MSNIEWTERTWNPVIGCAKVSAGCKHCYAETMAKRQVAMGNRDYPDVVGPDGRWNGTAKFLPHRLDEPLKWRKPQMVFVNSMSDLFHENITFEQIAAIFGVMAVADWHTYQVLTKRPGRAMEWFRWIQEHDHRPNAGPWTECHWQALCEENRRIGDDGPIHRKGRGDDERQWPLKNVWIGVSVENQAEADKRIPILLQIPSAVRFLSCEPLLGPIDLERRLHYNAGSDGEKCGHGLIQWIIVGGESGPGARPCNVAWIRDIVAQCKAAWVACFVKQLGANIRDRNDAGFDADCVWDADTGEWENPSGWPSMDYDRIENNPDGIIEEYQGAQVRIHLLNKKGGDPSEWPADLRVREFPKVSA